MVAAKTMAAALTVFGKSLIALKVLKRLLFLLVLINKGHYGMKEDFCCLKNRSKALEQCGFMSKK